MDRKTVASFLARPVAFVAALAWAAALAAPSKDWTMTSLGTLPSAHPFSTAEAVNNAGDVVGWSTVFDASINSNRVYAVLWRDG